MSEAHNFTNDRLENMITNMSECKIGYVSLIEECKKLRDVNTKLELELKEARELEKSHRYHLQASRDMMGNLQETISQLVYLKRDMKKLKEDILSKDIDLAMTQKDKEILQQKHDEILHEMKNGHEKHIDELISINDKKLLQVQLDSDTQIAQFTCVIEELREKLKEIEIEHKDKMNIVVLEYEEKIQRSAAEVAQLQEQLTLQSARSDSNIDAYRKKLEDLEEKLKQSKFKEYLAQSNYQSQSQYENRVERPYSTNTYINSFTDNNSVSESPKPKQNFISTMYTNKVKTPLQVTYHDAKSNMPKNEKKRAFQYNEKEEIIHREELSKPVIRQTI